MTHRDGDGRRGPRRAWGTFCIVVDVPRVPLATEGSKAHHALCTAQARLVEDA